MGFWSNLFKPSQPAAKLAPSGSLTRYALESIAGALCFNVRAAHGADWLATPITNTNSMLPLMDANCVVLLEKCPFEDLRTGDIVEYDWSARGIFALHRLGEKDSAGNFVVAGDNNAVNDGVRVTPQNFQRRLCGILYGAKDAKTDL